MVQSRYKLRCPNADFLSRKSNSKLQYFINSISLHFNIISHFSNLSKCCFCSFYDVSLLQLFQKHSLNAGLISSICPRDKPYFFAICSQFSLTTLRISSAIFSAFTSEIPKRGAVPIASFVEIRLSALSTRRDSPSPYGTGFTYIAPA